MTTTDPTTAAYLQLAGRVDAFFARVNAAHPGQMQCRKGCAMCCHPHLHLLPFEWSRVRDAVRSLSTEAHAEILARLEAPTAPTACALLDSDLSCMVFEARPMVCRSHGLPLRQGASRLTCELNFVGTLDDLPEGDILDDAQLGVMVGLMNRLGQEAGLYTDGAPRDADGRVPLRAALVQLLRAEAAEGEP